jgi:hypothetical protein
MLLLLSVTGFLLFSISGKRRADTLAGIMLSLSLIKPHLLLLVYLHLFGNAISERRYHRLLGFLCGAVILSGIASLIHGGCFLEYWTALQAPPVYFKTPTAGIWLQELTGKQEAFWRFLPTVVALGVLTVALLAAPGIRGNRSIAVKLIPLSLVLSPYGWGYDQVTLLPVALMLLATELAPKRFRLLSGLLIAGNILYFLIPGSLGQQVLVWYPVWIFALAVTFSTNHKGVASD